MKTQWIRGLAAAVLLVVALIFLTAGITRTHKVYHSGAGDFGVMVFDRITDRDLVVDTTFGGVTRIDTKLYSTYDRSGDGGKRACPT